MAQNKFDKTKSILDILNHALIFSTSSGFCIPSINFFGKGVGENEKRNDLGFRHGRENRVPEIEGLTLFLR